MTRPTPSRSRYVWTTLIAAGGLLLLALLVTDLDSPRLGRALLDEAGTRVGSRIEATDFRLNLLRGLELVDLRARSRLPEGRLVIEAEAMRFGHRILPLLRGRVVVTEATLKSPDIRFSRRSRPRSDDAATAGGGPGGDSRAQRLRRQASAAAAGADGAPPQGQNRDPRASLKIESLDLVDGRLLVAEAGAELPTLEISGLDLELHDLVAGSEPSRRLSGSTARGTLAADQVALGSTVARDLSGLIELEGGRLELDQLRLLLAAGQIVAETVQVDLTQDSLPYFIELEGRSLDGGVLLGAGADSGMGTADLSFTGSGVASGSSELDGAGRLALRAGRLPPIPLFTSLDSLLGRSELVGAPYEDLTVPFRVRGQRLLVDSCRLIVGNARLSLSGWAERQGELSLRIVVSAPREQVKIGELPDSLLDKLTDAQGVASLAFSVTGTRDRPRVVPDLPAMSKPERRELERALKREIRDRLRDLVRRDG